MRVLGLDHVNIIAADLDETIRFYEQVLGLSQQARPEQMEAALRGGWLFDAAGRAVIHLMTHELARHGEGDRRAMPTGSIDHVAFTCQDFPAMRRRLDGLGVAYRYNCRKYGDFSQIFLTDPNNVKLELNFPGE